MKPELKVVPGKTTGPVIIGDLKGESPVVIAHELKKAASRGGDKLAHLAHLGNAIMSTLQTLGQIEAERKKLEGALGQFHTQMQVLHHSGIGTLAKAGVTRKTPDVEGVSEEFQTQE